MKNRSVFTRVWDYLRRYKSSVFLAVFLKTISAVMNALEPFVLGLIITELTKNLLDIANGVEGAQINYSYIAIMLAIYALRALLYEIGAYGSNYFMTKAVQGATKELRQDLSHKINKIPVSYFDKHQYGDLLGRFTSDVETVSNALQQSFLQLVNAVLTLSLAIFMCFWLDVSLALVVVTLVPVTYFGSKFVMGKSQPYFKQQADALGRLNGFVQENLTGFNVLKLYGREEISTEEFRQITADLQEVGFKASFMSGLLMPWYTASQISPMLSSPCYLD